MEGSTPSRRCRHHGRARSRPGIVGRQGSGPAAEETSGSSTTPETPHARHPPRLVAHDRHHRRRARLRRHRPRPAAARAVAHGGRHRAGRLRRPGDRLRHRRLGGGGPRLRHPVLRRLADRVLALGRQPVHLHDHHEPVRRTPGAAAERAPGRDRAGPRDARHLHRGRRRGHRDDQLGLLRLRGLPALHGGEAGARRRAPTTTSTRRTAWSPSSAAGCPRPRAGTAPTWWRTSTAGG